LRGAPTRDDLQLIERVRARIGRAVSNPHAIQVGASEGRVTLSGPVLASEAEELVETARHTPGVWSVEDHLAVHREPGSIPSLQGTPRPRDRGSPFLDANGPVMRAATIGAGLALAAVGATRGSLAGLALAGIGAAIAATGARFPHPEGRVQAAETPRHGGAPTAEAPAGETQQA
jgi:hypothetical protein